MSGPVLDTMPRALTPLLRVGVVVAAIAAVLGTVTHGPVSEAAGGVAVGAIVAVPLMRVAVLGVHWCRQRDVRYAVAAFGLVLVAVAGAGLALL